MTVRNGIKVLFALGGNLPSRVGTPLDTQRAALERLQRAGLEIVCVSHVYETTPVPPSGQPDFINMAAVGLTDLSAQALLDLFLDTETALGRARGERWSARTLDIDLLAYGDAVLPSAEIWQAAIEHPDPAHILSEVMVPHPRLHLRSFVLVPLADVAPDWRHPLLRATVTELLAAETARSGLEGVRRISEGAGRFPALQGGEGAV